MTLTFWADVSEHQGRPVNNQYREPVISFRANDGTYMDELFDENDGFVRHSAGIVFYFIYNVWPRSIGFSGWQSSFAQFVGMLGMNHRPNLIITDDVETWSREDLRHDFSEALEAKRKAEVDFLHTLRPDWQQKKPLRMYYRWKDNRRVVGYGNRGDLATQAGNRRKVKWRFIILADYSDTPTPRKFNGWRVISRQYTDTGRRAPWDGNIDVNRSDGTPRHLARRLGLGRLRWSLH